MGCHFEHGFTKAIDVTGREILRYMMPEERSWEWLRYVEIIPIPPNMKHVLVTHMLHGAGIFMNICQHLPHEWI